MVCGVLCADGLPWVLYLPGRLLDVCHGDEYDGVAIVYDTVSFRLVCFDSELLDCIHEFATEVELRCNEGLVLVTHI